MRRADLARETATLLPGFRPRGPLRRSLKSLLLRGIVDGTPALVKKLARRETLWRWYFQRELQLYRSFAAAPPPVRCPRLLASDEQAGLLVLEAPGEALTARRRLGDVLPPPLLAALLAIGDALGDWAEGAGLAATLGDPPAPADRLAMRRRLLEDPSDPLGWVVAGLERGASTRLVEPELGAQLIAALRAHPAVGFGHGDLLPRNVLRTDDGIAVVDWECAGLHPVHWDRALLWANVPAARRELEAQAARGDAASERAFWACAGYALMRELKFRRTRRAGVVDPGAVLLRAELTEVARHVR